MKNIIAKSLEELIGNTYTAPVLIYNGTKLCILWPPHKIVPGDTFNVELIGKNALILHEILTFDYKYDILIDLDSNISVLDNYPEYLNYIGTEELADESFNCIEKLIIDGLNIENPSIVLFLSSGNHNIILSLKNSINFLDNTYITNIVIGENTKLVKLHFDGCTNLESVTFENDIVNSEIPAAAFRDCSNLKIINNCPQILKVGSLAFKNCSSLQEIDLSMATSISSNAFYGCSELTSVSLSPNITNLGSSAFLNCSKLALVEYDGQVWTSKSELLEHLEDLAAISPSKAFDGTALSD